MMTTDRCRDWMLTLPEEYYSRDIVEDKLRSYDYIGQLESGKESGYRHFQIYVENKNAIKFETLRSKFPRGHYEPRRESKSQCLKYCTKSDTRVPGHSLLAGGKFVGKDVDELLKDRLPRTKRDISAEISEKMLKENVPASTLIQDPRYAQFLKYIDALETIRLKNLGLEDRDALEVHYLYGPSRVGKTYKILHGLNYDLTDIYRVSNFKYPWDNYEGQSVLLLDEFAGQISFEFLLQVLDKYQLELNARYRNKWACWTQVWIVSNLPMESLPYYRRVSPEQWRALCMRFTSYQRMESDRSLVNVPFPSAS